MRLETVQRRLYMSYVSCAAVPKEVRCGVTRTGYAATGGPGTENCANESAAKARSGVFGGNNQDGQRLGGSTGSDSRPCDGAARVEPACERRNLRQRGPVHGRNSRRTGPSR